MPTFDMIVVGCGGGPDETNLSSYLLKPAGADWKDGIIALEAGSGQGALNQILKQNPKLLVSSTGGGSKHSASEIYSFVRCFLITHAHLDHVNSLVISAGSLKGPRKRVYAARQTLEDLESIFSDRIWPNLASWSEQDETYKLLYTSLRADSMYTNIHPGVSVLMMDLNHGRNDTGTYESAAFFIRDDASSHELLFFGDVEPDTVADKPQTINVWRAAAPKIPRTLSTIFIECSWLSGHKDELLYGHLNPEHLTSELVALATEVVRYRKGIERDARSSLRPLRKKLRKNPPSPSLESVRGALDGLRVYVMHCKDSMDGASERPVNQIIVDQVRALVETSGVGAEILAAEQGMRIAI